MSRIEIAKHCIKLAARDIRPFDADPYRARPKLREFEKSEIKKMLLHEHFRAYTVRIVIKNNICLEVGRLATILYQLLEVERRDRQSWLRSPGNGGVLDTLDVARICLPSEVGSG